MIAELLTVFSGGAASALASAASGLIGGYLTKRENRLMQAQENAHELLMAKQDVESDKMALLMVKAEQDRIKLNGDVAKDLVDANSAAAVNIADAKAFTAGILRANEASEDDWVSKLRRITRPLLTWALFTFVVVIFGVLHVMVSDIVKDDTETLAGLYVYIVQACVYLTIMAVSWWFMARGENSAAQIKALRN